MYLPGSRRKCEKQREKERNTGTSLRILGQRRNHKGHLGGWGKKMAWVQEFKTKLGNSAISYKIKEEGREGLRKSCITTIVFFIFLPFSPSFYSLGYLRQGLTPETHYVAQAGLILIAILLPQLTEDWDSQLTCFLH